jgi:hypothetical protein
VGAAQGNSSPTAAVDAALAAAQRDVAGGSSPEADCRRAETLIAQLRQSKTIDDATVQLYQSQIAFVRSLADDAALAVKLKQLDTDLSALEVKVSDERPKLRSSATDPVEARQLDEKLWPGVSAIAARLEVMPQDDARVVAMANRLAPLRDELAAAQLLLAQREAGLEQGMNPSTMPAAALAPVNADLPPPTSGATPPPLTLPARAAVVSSVVISPPASARTVSVPTGALSIPRSAAEPVAIESSVPIERVMVMPAGRPIGQLARPAARSARGSNPATRLAWTLTGLLAAGLAYLKSRSPEQMIEPRGGSAAISGWAIFMTQIDLLGLVLAMLGVWWLCSAPADGLVAAAALIACGLLAAGDVLTNRLGLSSSAPQTARRFAGPTATAAAVIFALHLLIGGAGFI